MHALRTTAQLTRLVLAWFVLALGVAALAPVLQPQAMELVCSDAGRMKFVAVGEDGDAAPMGQHTLGCAACLAVLPPPTVPQLHLAQAMPRDVLRVAIAPALLAKPAGAPLPPRGPPAQA